MILQGSCTQNFKVLFVTLNIGIKIIFLMSLSSSFIVDLDVFLNFLSSSYSLGIRARNKPLKWGAKDASRGAKDASGDGICQE